MRYGTVPIAHKTGGLKDTVLDFDPWAQKGTGWTYTSCDAQVGVPSVGYASVCLIPCAWLYVPIKGLSDSASILSLRPDSHGRLP